MPNTLECPHTVYDWVTKDYVSPIVWIDSTTTVDGVYTPVITTTGGSWGPPMFGPAPIVVPSIPGEPGFHPGQTIPNTMPPIQIMPEIVIEEEVEKRLKKRLEEIEQAKKVKEEPTDRNLKDI